MVEVALPTVARFLLAGRPRPRIEEAVTIGDLMRRATLAQFSWRSDETARRAAPTAPPEVSGRDSDGRPLMDPRHAHAFWLPEDADGDGRIDHVSVFIGGGIRDDVRAKLDRITRLWLAPRRQPKGSPNGPASVREWRLALEGFGQPADFADNAGIFGTSRRWRSATPFLASGHLKASGYRGEVRRILQRRGRQDAADVDVSRRATISVGDTERPVFHFRRIRVRGRETQPDTEGASLDIVFPRAHEGPLAIGYGSHFGLGLFVAESMSDP